MDEIYIELPENNLELTKVTPEKYVLTRELAGAVKVAIALNKPLLLTGEPGTGKTSLAFRIAADLNDKNENFEKEPLVFNTKTTSSAQDVLYFYDALRHFHEANIAKAESQSAPPIEEFIELRALGKAIAQTNNKPELWKKYGLQMPENEEKPSPKSIVVLIDEIDKAPRDFTNDLLNEIEKFRFRIKENNEEIIHNKEYRIVVIMTSNSEKNLPDAFLRRCVFYHIPFPSKHEMQKIIKKQLGETSRYSDTDLIDHFYQIRDSVRKKKPATAEFINWLRVLEIEKFLKKNNKLDFSNLTPEQQYTLKLSYSVLAKTKEDLDEILNKYTD